MKIAIIMPCYWPDQIVDRALNSINQQTKKENVVVYMVNNCSPNTTDEYQSIIQKYNNLQIKYIKNKHNKGCGNARNLALQCTKEPYIMFMDDDDFLYNEFVIENYIRLIYQSHNKKIACIETNYIEQIDSVQTPYSPFERNALLGTIYSKLFLNDLNITFNKKLLWRQEDYFFIDQVYLYAQLNDYLIIKDKSMFSYIHYHTKKTSSLCWDINEDPNKHYESKEMIVTIMHDLIFFAEKIKFYQQIGMKNLDKDRKQDIFNILKHIYVSSNTILELFENGYKINSVDFSQEEIDNCIESWYFLIDLINKNRETIEKNIMYIKSGENYPRIGFEQFEKRFEEKIKNLTKI